MRRLLLVVAVVLALPCLVVGQAPAQKAAPAPVTSVAQQIMTLEQEWSKADSAQDLAWFERHLADSYVDVSAFTGQEGNKAAYLADVRARNWKSESNTASDLKVQVFGDVAVVTGVLTLVKATFKGQDRSGKLRFIDTWVRRAGVWQCVASADAMITAK